MRRVELALAAAGGAPLLYPVAVLVVELSDPRIDVAVADEYVALGIPGDVGRLPELAVDGRTRRVHVLPRLGSFVGRFFLASEEPSRRALRD